MLSKLDQNENNVQHLKAQVQYKLTEYTKAAKIYQKLLDTATDDEITDSMTNYLACQASGADESLKVIEDLINKMPNESEKTYELYFNLSQI